MRFTQMLWVSIVCAAASGIALGADPPATDTSAAAPASETQGLEEVSITAERIESTPEKTPISLEVYSAQDLAEEHVTDVFSLVSVDPSLNIISSGSAPIIAIRGVSSGNTTEIGDPAVSVATDGAFSNRPYGLLIPAYDLNRIEVLRGPQGTLFGRNATGARSISSRSVRR